MNPRDSIGLSVVHLSPTGRDRIALTRNCGPEQSGWGAAPARETWSPHPALRTMLRIAGAVPTSPFGRVKKEKTRAGGPGFP